LGSRLTRGLLFGGAGEEVARGGGVPDGGLVADAEHGGGVEGVGSGGEGLVIGTMWPVSDLVAVAMAKAIYADLTRNDTGPVQPEQAAHALHRATLRLRERYPETPEAWAAYLHVGL
jgi:hypothetical protein